MKWLASVLLCQLVFFLVELPRLTLFVKWLASVLFCQLGIFLVELLVMTRKCPVLRTRWFFVGTTWNNFSVCYISGFPDWISSYNSCKPDKGHWKCERCKYFAIKLLLQASVTNTKLTNLTNQQAMTSFKFFNISAYCGLWWWLAQFGLSWNHCLFLILWLVNFIHH